MKFTRLPQRISGKFLPGTKTFSVGTFGCNLGCVFCQNSHLSRGSYGRQDFRYIPPEELVKLIPEVRAVRAKLEICPSAKEGVCVTDILNEIICKQVYKDDYEDITLGLLFIPETYDTVIQSIKQLADSGIWN